MFKKVLSAAIALAALASLPAMAQDKRMNFTAALTGVSDYSFRGISQSDNGPALQGSFEGAFTINDYVTGYASLFASNVHFVPEPTDNDGASLETDFTFGFRSTIDNFGYDARMIYYSYPGASAGVAAGSANSYDYWEAALTLNYDFGFVVPSVGINYSQNFFGNSGEAVYYTAGVKVPVPFVPYDTRILANIGKQYIKKNATFGTPDYMDWNVGIFATFFGFDVGVQYVDTNLSKTECFNNVAAEDLCKARPVFSLGRTFTF